VNHPVFPFGLIAAPIHKQDFQYGLPNWKSITQDKDARHLFPGRQAKVWSRDHG
jgi:hypothetical protein